MNFFQYYHEHYIIINKKNIAWQNFLKVNIQQSNFLNHTKPIIGNINIDADKVLPIPNSINNLYGIFELKLTNNIKVIAKHVTIHNYDMIREECRKLKVSAYIYSNQIIERYLNKLLYGVSNHKEWIEKYHGDNIANIDKIDTIGSLNHIPYPLFAILSKNGKFAILSIYHDSIVLSIYMNGKVIGLINIAKTWTYINLILLVIEYYYLGNIDNYFNENLDDFSYKDLLIKQYKKIEQFNYNTLDNLINDTYKNPNLTLGNGINRENYNKELLII